MTISKQLDSALKTNKNHPRYLDLDGCRFGKLLILKSDLPNRKVLAKCDCGKEIEVNKSSITTGHTTSCGKGLCHPHTKNLINKKFGFLTVLRFIDNQADSYGTWWECLCECGKLHNVVSHSLVTGQTKSCGCKAGILYSEKKTKDNNESVINTLYSSYQSHAKKLKIDFLLTNNEFKIFIQDSCYYCGASQSNIRKLKSLTGPKEFKYNGIDRVDSSKNYQVENCVTACKDCNLAKRKLSHNDFILLAKKIASRF